MQQRPRNTDTDLSLLDAYDLYQYCRQHRADVLSIWENVELRSKIHIDLWGNLALQNEALAKQVMRHPRLSQRGVNNLTQAHKAVLKEKVIEKKENVKLSQVVENPNTATLVVSPSVLPVLQPIVVMNVPAVEEKEKPRTSTDNKEKSAIPSNSKQQENESFEHAVTELIQKENDISILLPYVVQATQLSNHSEAKKILQHALSMVEDMKRFFNASDHKHYPRLIEVENITKR